MNNILLFLILILIILINNDNLKEYFKNGVNINDKELEICSLEPVTGYFRDGYCHTDETDEGTHTVCGVVTDDFLKFTKSKGNDLTKKGDSFPGLKDGDSWCLCAGRWKEAYDHDKSMAPKIKIDATNKKTLDYINKDILLSVAG